MTVPSKINVVIPMAGFGTRFRKAGIQTYKPFLAINDKPMVQHVLDAFPTEMHKYCIINPELCTQEQRTYLAQLPNVHLIFIEPHSNGPAYSILKAGPQLPLEEGFFISYCDIAWTWDFEAIQKHLHADGVVFTHEGFHPHLVGNNFSAFCLPESPQNRALAQIREKSSFTENWMSEPLSIGLFYIKSGNEMLRHLKEMIEGDERVANEFFPSLLFNRLVKNHKLVSLCSVDFFIHWGNPEQLQDYYRWTKIVKSVSGNAIPQKRKNICCMGGLGARMKHISPLPKALLPVAGIPMYEFVVKQFACDQNEALTTDPLVEELKREKVYSKVISVGQKTHSQLETLTLGVPHLTKTQDFLLSSCDAFGLYDRSLFDELIRTKRPDAIIFTFTPSLLHSKLVGQHTHVSTQDGQITRVHIKVKPNTDDKGLAGFFWFQDGRVFEEIKKVPQDVKYEMCVDHFLKYLVDTNRKVLELRLDEYVHLGTPDEYLEFQFWWQYRDCST